MIFLKIYVLFINQVIDKYLLKKHTGYSIMICVEVYNFASQFTEVFDMEIYLDNSATTKPYPEAVEAVSYIMSNCYGNPSSLHRMGKSAEDILTKSREIIAGTVFCTPDEIYFTSGGTESDNIAILGYCLANHKRGKKVITQKTEHKAVLESFSLLEKHGFEVVYLDVDKNGVVDVQELKSHIDDKTILVSIMAANNETGAIFPIDEISALIDHKKCVLHVDAVQLYGKEKINVKRSDIDMLTVSSHKIHGPNGVGALFVRKGVRIEPFCVGGGQEKGLRSGTENIASVWGFATAAKMKFENLPTTSAHIKNLRDRLIQGISDMPNAVINSPKDALYSILNVSFVGVRSEVLLHVLESKGIYVSTGSACNSKKSKFSYVLDSMGVGADRGDSAIRFSFSEFNTEGEIDYCIEVLKKEVPILEKIMR